MQWWFGQFTSQFLTFFLTLSQYSLYIINNFISLKAKKMNDKHYLWSVFFFWNLFRSYDLKALDNKLWGHQSGKQFVFSKKQIFIVWKTISPIVSGISKARNVRTIILSQIFLRHRFYIYVIGNNGAVWNSVPRSRSFLFNDFSFVDEFKDS